jgi:molybdopterin-guanine dinucleotide biosynthesis protein A
MNLSAVLLTGGESRRMGRDKATIDFQGEPLWRRQLDLLRPIAPVEILISARSDPWWRPADTTFVSDKPPSRGPVSGLSAAMEVMRGTHLLVFAIDMPLIPPSVLDSMRKMIAPGRGILPKIGSRAEPLAAIYPRKCLPLFTGALSGADVSMQGVTERLVEAGLLSVFQVSKAEVPFYRSLNDPTDVQDVDGQHVVSSKTESAGKPNV